MKVLDDDDDNRNKLWKVTHTGNQVHGFKDGPKSKDDWDYDLNGNKVSDWNKGTAVGGIEYKHINMRTNITVIGDNYMVTVDDVYKANGVKLRKSDNKGTTTHYVGSFVYANSNLKQIPRCGQKKHRR